jgi:MFS family permease
MSGLANTVSAAPQSSNSPELELQVSASEFDLSYYGWRVALAACFGVMAGFGSLFVYTFSVFVKPLGAEFGWTRETISRGFAIAAVTLGACSPFLGRWIDRFGPRRMILVCITIFGCGIGSLAVLRSGVWQFYVTCFVLGAVGNGAAHLAYSRSISTWFEKRLGTALALVMVGAGLGAMILPVVAQALVSAEGWRMAYAFLGTLALILGLPLSFRYIRDKKDQPRADLQEPAVLSGMSWGQGMRSYAFWIIVAILCISAISMNGAISQLSAMLTDRGITAAGAALCASVLGGSSLLARVGVGRMLDRFFGAHVALVVNVITALGIFMLARANTVSTGSLAAVLIGVGAGGEAALTPYLLTRYFGLRGFSTLYGVTWTFYAAAAAVGPVILARTFDATGSYASVLVTLAAVLGVSAGMNLFLPRYPHLKVL